MKPVHLELGPNRATLTVTDDELCNKLVSVSEEAEDQRSVGMALAAMAAVLMSMAILLFSLGVSCSSVLMSTLSTLLWMAATYQWRAHRTRERYLRLKRKFMKDAVERGWDVLSKKEYH